MSDSGERDNKWVAGELPSRRTGRARKAGAKPGGVLAKRLLRINNRTLLGRPLAHTLQKATGKRRRPSPKLLGGVLVAGGGCALLATAVAAEPPIALLAAGLVGIAAGALMLWRRERAAAQPSFPLQLRDHAAALDRYLDEVSPKLPRNAVAAIASTKETLARVLAALSAEDVGIPAEESFFVSELVSRYLPEACRHYVAAAEAIGANAVFEDGSRAEESLCRQLEVMNSRLQRILAMVAAARTEELARHEAFIRTKDSR